MISQNQTLGLIAMLEDLNSEITKYKKKPTNKHPPKKKHQKTNMICYKVIINHWRCGLVLY